jgi:endonuclease/exonuclease/phosphatase family metal-dependent hydrolase
MPSNGHSDYAATSCWDSLISLYKNFPKELPVICVGDFNTYTAGRINKRRMYEFMSYGLVDFWLEKGKSHNTDTFNAGTRIDYALVTDKDYSALAKKYDMEVDDSTRTGVEPLSDHSAIIIGTPTELKPFRKGDKK